MQKETEEEVKVCPTKPPETCHAGISTTSHSRISWTILKGPKKEATAIATDVSKFLAFCRKS